MRIRLINLALAIIFTTLVAPLAQAQQPVILSFDLVDTSGNTLVSNIANDSTIYLSNLSSQHFSVRANTISSPLVGIYFYLTNYYTGASIYSNPVTTAPYYLCSLSGSDPVDCSSYLTAGSSACGTTYAVQAVPYTSSSGGSVAGVPSTVRFTIAATPPTGSTPTMSLSQDSAGQNVTISLTGTSCRLQIDDTTTFITPIQDVAAPASPGTTFSILSYGLVPGTTYNFRLLPSNTLQTIKVQPTKWTVSLPGGVTFASYLSQAWPNSGALWMQANSGITYTAGQSSPWSLNTNWSNGYESASTSDWNNLLVGAQAEDAEVDATKALNEVVVYNETASGGLMEQLAQYYNSFYGTNSSFNGPHSRLMTLGAMQSMSAFKDNNGNYLNVSQLTLSGTNGPSGSNARTLPNVSGGAVIDCYLCDEIFFYPAAKLLRLISTVPPGSRTLPMNTFVTNYLPLLRDDQLIRLMYYQLTDLTPTSCYEDIAPMQSASPALANSQGQTWAVALWQYKTAHPTLATGETNPECRAMFNNDLYLIGMSAEILGANANDPFNIPLTVAQNSSLRTAVESGVAFFQTKSHTHSTTDFNGNSITGVSYFDGDGSILTDQIYAGFTTDCFPVVPASPATAPDVCSNAPISTTAYNVSTVSWDISHYAAVLPMFLRSLFDNKKAIQWLTGGFPASSDIASAANELTYVSLRNHTTSAGRTYPLFNNYMDGSNGWYRVTYDGANAGYPPAQDCNMSQATQYTSPDSGNPIPLTIRPCLTPGTTLEWGLLSNFQSDLSSLQQSLVSLALATDSTSNAFKDQYYFSVYPFAYLNSSGQVQYPPSLLNLLSLNASQLP